MPDKPKGELNPDAARMFPTASSGFGEKAMEEFHEENGEKGFDFDVFRKRKEAAQRYWGPMYLQWCRDWEAYGGNVIPRAERRKLRRNSRSAINVSVHHKFIRNLLGNDVFEFTRLKAIEIDLPGNLMEPVSRVFMNSAGDREYSMSEVYTGILEHVMGEARTSDELMECAENMIIAGFGMLRVCVMDEDEVGYVNKGETWGWNKVPAIRNVKDPCSVLLDFQAENAQYEDAAFAMQTSTMTYASMRDAFGKKKADEAKNGIRDMEYEVNSEDDSDDWYSEDQYQVVEYFERDVVIRDVCLLEDEQGTLRSVFKEDYEGKEDEALAMGLQKVEERGRKEFVITRWVVNGRTVLQGPDILPMDRIPFIPAWGDRAKKNGKMRYFGLMRVLRPLAEVFAKLYSASMDYASGGPLASFLYPVEGVKGPVRQAWDESPKKPTLGLPWQEYVRDQKISAPIPIAPRPPHVHMTELLAFTLQLFHESTGMPPNTLGGARGKSPESARSKFASQEAMSLTVGVFPRNWKRTLRSAGRLVMHMIPILFDRDMFVAMSDGRDSTDFVQINQNFIVDEQTGEQAMMNDLTQEARMNLKVMVDEMAPGQREAKFTFLQEVTKGNDDLVMLFIDEFFELAGIPGGENVKKKLAMLVKKEELLTGKEAEDKFDGLIRALQFEKAKRDAISEILGPPEPSPEDKKNMAQAEHAQAQADEARANASGAGSDASDKEAERQHRATMRGLEQAKGQASTEQQQIKAASESAKALDDSDARRQALINHNQKEGK